MHSVKHARLDIEYDGTELHGWSRQPDRPTVEGAIFTASAELGLEIIELQCAGRTDAGVHAIAQVASLAYRGPVEIARLAHALNGRLPKAICVHTATACDPAFSARHSALERTYEYRILPGRTRAPLRYNRTFHHPRPLDRTALDTCAHLALGKHDFTAFTPSQTDHVFFARTLTCSEWLDRGDELVYRVGANAFLHRMVRVLVGTMLAVGRGERDCASFAALLEGAPRSAASKTAPARGLCLVGVTYHPRHTTPQHAAGRASRSFTSPSIAIPDTGGICHPAS